MTQQLAIEYIARRMCELCSTDYHLRFRHLRLQAGETRIILAHTDLFILVEPPADVRILSDIGLFDVAFDGIQELQYEHRGTIQITNLSLFANHVRFIQIIP